MSNPLYKAIIKNSGKEVEVYKLNNGGYADFADCSTKYSKKELIIKNEKS